MSDNRNPKHRKIENVFIGVGINAMVILLVIAVLNMANNRAIDAIRTKCENIAKVPKRSP